MSDKVIEIAVDRGDGQSGIESDGSNVKRKIAAILAADIVGYSRLVAEDEEETLRRLADYRNVFKEFVSRCGGRIFNTAGDAVLADFQSAVDAVRCAIDIQESTRARNLAYPPSRQMNFRIGITIGDVVEREGDLLGDGVNVAARLESIAPPGGICVSRAVYEAVMNKTTVNFADIGQQQLKNMPDRVHAYTIDLHDPETTKRKRTVTKRTKQPGAIASRLPLFGAVVAGLIGAAVMFWFIARPDFGSKIEETPYQAAKAEKPADKPPSTTPKAETPKTVTADDAHTKPPAEAPKQEAKVDSEAFPSTLPPPSTNPYDTRRQSIDMQRCIDGQTEDALPSCERLVKSGLFSGESLASIFVSQGRAYRDKGETDKAIESYNESLKAQETADAYNQRGIAYYDKSDWDNAIADYGEAIRLDPRNGEALNNRAWTLYRAGKAKDALSDANKAVEFMGNQGYVWDTRGHVYEALGNKTAAVSDYRKSLQLDPDSTTSKSGLRRLGATQ